VDDNKLTNQNEVKIIQEENQLIIQAEDYQRPFKEREIFAKESLEDNIRGIIFTMVRLGYDRFKIFFDKKEKEKFTKTISKIIEDYVFGYEIVEIKENYCIIDNVITAPTNVENIEKKSLLIVKDTFNELIKILSENKVKINSIIAHNKKMVQFDSLLRNNYSRHPLKNNPFKWQRYRDTYVIQRELLNLAKISTTQDKKSRRFIVKILKKLEEIFNEIYLANYKYDDPAHLEKTGVKIIITENEINTKINKIKDIEPLILCYLFEIARTINLFNYTLLQLKISEGDD
jgi:hypothetical protein